MGTEKGKGFRTLIFCTELSPETITKTMVIISKYEVEYKETEDISALKGDFELVLSNFVYIHCQPIFQSFP